MDVKINGFGGLSKEFEGFEFLKRINLQDYKDNQLALFKMVFDYADTYDNKNERNIIVKSLIADICMIPYQKKEEDTFKIDDKILELMCQVYFNENKTFGFNSDSAALNTFLTSYPHPIIFKFFEHDNQYTTTKAAFLIEIYSTCKHQSTLKKNFNGSLYHLAKKHLKQWQIDGINFSTYELAEKLLERMVYGSRFKVSNTNQERFFSYIDDQFYSQLMEKHPEFIFNTNKSFLVSHLIDKGYHQVISEHKEKTKEKINYYLKECMFTQAKMYLPYVFLQKEDLIQTDEYIKEKFKTNSFQRIMYEDFKVYLETQYLNSQLLDSQKEVNQNKVKVKI